jgi:hypothetical protein
MKTNRLISCGITLALFAFIFYPAFLLSQSCFSTQTFTTGGTATTFTLPNTAAICYTIRIACDGYTRTEHFPIHSSVVSCNASTSLSAFFQIQFVKIDAGYSDVFFKRTDSGF